MFFGLKTPVTISTSLSRLEVIERLSRSIDSPGFFFPVFGSFGLVGRVEPDCCWFEKGSFLQRSNRRLTLCYEDGEMGTVLKGNFALPTLQLISLGLFFLVGIFLCIAFTVSAISNRHSADGSAGLWNLMPFGILIAGFLMMKFNLWLGHGKEQELIETLEQILQGPPIATFYGGNQLLQAVSSSVPATKSSRQTVLPDGPTPPDAVTS